jgi:two-component system copper resistance phosphate regulon response regulator CusR
MPCEDRADLLYETGEERILVIEDNLNSAAHLKKGLSERGFVVEVGGNSEEGPLLVRTSHYDLLVLDIMLRERDGNHFVSAGTAARSRESGTKQGG